VRFHKVGGPEVLKIEDLDVSPPKKREVQISIKAIGLNRAESMFRSGQYVEDPKLPAMKDSPTGALSRSSPRRSR
jgi:NADPH:quinone reductase-like Zn-dependent oxidoreductase